MRQRKYDYELIVQMHSQAYGWEDLESVQTDSTYYYNLDYSEGTDPRGHKRARTYANYLRIESVLAYGAGVSFRTIRRRTKKGAQA